MSEMIVTLAIIVAALGWMFKIFLKYVNDDIPGEVHDWDVYYHGKIICRLRQMTADDACRFVVKYFPERTIDEVYDYPTGFISLK